MDGQRFDNLARTLATRASRRRLLKSVAGGITASLVGRQVTVTAAEDECTTLGRRCSSGTDCCSGTCEFDARGRGRCGACPDRSCPDKNYFDPRDCQCYCEYDRKVCADDEVCTKPIGCQPAGGCAAGKKRCQDGCIAENACCTSDDCPDDGLSCTVNQCEAGSGICITMITDGFCVIGNTCVANGTPRAGHPCQVCDPTRSTDDWSTAEGAPCGGDGVCAGNCHGGVCQFPNSSESCAASTCTGGIQTDYHCDGAGACVPRTIDCGLYHCGGDGSCHTDCADNSDCVGDAHCNPATHTCEGDGGLGASCTNGDQCQSGHCVDDVCCAYACAAPDHGAATCTADGHTCGFSCDATYQPCDDACIPDSACCTPDDCQLPTNPCLVATCDDHTCDTAAGNDGGTCGDGKICCAGTCCDAGSVCTEAGCAAGDKCPAGKCDYLNSYCRAGICDPATGSCSANYVHQGLACADPCQVNAVCRDGECRGTPKDCSGTDDECNVGVCDPDRLGECMKQPINNGKACNNGDGLCADGTCEACGKVSDSCDAETPCCDGFECCGGICIAPCPACQSCNASAKSCTNDNALLCDFPCYAVGQCIDGACFPITGTILRDNSPCDDGNLCTYGTICHQGACIGAPKDCSSLNDPGQCTSGVCNPDTGACKAEVQAGTPCGDICCPSDQTCADSICYAESATILTYTTPGTDSVDLPQDITCFSIEVAGASGGHSDSGGAGGAGGRARVSIRLDPSVTYRTIDIVVGEQGGNGSGTAGGGSGGSGYGNGGNGGSSAHFISAGAGGGGSSAALTTNTPIVIAGGGGGGGAGGDSGTGDGGAGGGPQGGMGNGRDGGHGGTQSSAGAAGDIIGGTGISAGHAGQGQNGGAGGSSGGGGGGGYYGGGGAALAGAGGGSGYIIDNSNVFGSFLTSNNQGNGKVTIIYPTQCPD